MTDKEDNSILSTNINRNRVTYERMTDSERA